MTDPDSAPCPNGQCEHVAGLHHFGNDLEAETPVCEVGGCRCGSVEPCMNPECDRPGTIAVEVYGHQVGFCCERCVPAPGWTTPDMADSDDLRETIRRVERHASDEAITQHLTADQVAALREVRWVLEHVIAMQADIGDA